MFEWDQVKNLKNQLKHGVSFKESATSFADPLGLDGPDVLHSVVETRYLRIGQSTLENILTTAYTLRIIDDSQKIRIISSRKASAKERKEYAQAR